MTDFLQEAAWAVAAAGGAVAALKAAWELEASRKNAERDLRWRKALAASALLDRPYEDDCIRDALIMLDWHGRPFQISSSTPEPGVPITHDDIYGALAVADVSYDPKALFIRTRMDRLFEGFERIGHALRIGLIEYEDVEFALEFYITMRLAKQKDVVTTFLKTQGFDAALQFFNRCPGWRDPARAAEITLPAR
jgi:hypothetical protein